MKKTVLIMEDRLEILENMSEILELDGYKVLSARNGKDGLDMAWERSPGLILCDIMMPEINGYEVLYILKRDPLTKKIPFVFISSKSESADLRRAVKKGANGFLVKPFGSEILLETVNKLYQKPSIQKNLFSTEE